MHAVSSRKVAERNFRKCLGQEYRFFYNPMWCFLGDHQQRELPTGTYYYGGSGAHELFWHMLDQVMVRPELMNSFPPGGIKIVTKIRNQDLLTASGIPDDNAASDHLPVVFRLDLESQT